MGRILKGTPLNFGNPKQVVWVRTTAGDFACTAETEINSSEVTVVVQDNGTAHAFCESAPKESYRRIVRNERGYPRIPEEIVLCKLLQIAFVYRIINANKSQQIWLSDFGGNTHLIKTIPAAIDYGDLTYTVNYTVPAYTWKRYDIVTNNRREIGTSVYESLGGRLWDMQLAAFPPGDPPYADSGSVNAAEGSYTGRYTCDHPVGSPPPTPSVETGGVNVSIADRIIPGFRAGDSSGPANPIPSRPPTSVFEAAEDGDSDYPYEIGWGDLPNTEGPYTGLLDGNGNLITGLIPYFFSGEDDAYWAVQLTGQTIQNPGGVGFNSGDGFRYMTGVSTSRYRTFSGTISFSVPPGQSRPQPENVVAEVETFLSYSNGILQVLIRDTGRPDGMGPGQNCQPGEHNPMDPDDYFVNISKHELVSGAIQASTTLPNWMEVYDSPETRGNVLDGIADNNIQDQTFRYINDSLGQLDSFAFGKDWFVSPSDYIPVPNTDIESVYGWEVETVDVSNIKSIVLGTTDNEGFSYLVYPVQVDLDQYPTPMYIGRGGGTEFGEALPISAETNVNQIKATLSAPTIEGITTDNFDVMAVVPSWGDNTFEHCLDLTQIVPIELGGC